MTKHIRKISKYTPSILQGTLQFEVARPRSALAREFALERRALPALSIALIALVLAYLYFVASSILNVMGREDAQRQMKAIEGSIGALEQRYLALSQEVNPQGASALGLAPLQNTSYVYRPSAAAVAPSSRGTI